MEALNINRIVEDLRRQGLMITDGWDGGNIAIKEMFDEVEKLLVNSLESRGFVFTEKEDKESFKSLTFTQNLISVVMEMRCYQSGSWRNCQIEVLGEEKKKGTLLLAQLAKLLATNVGLSSVQISDLRAPIYWRWPGNINN